MTSASYLVWSRARQLSRRAARWIAPIALGSCIAWQAPSDAHAAGQSAPGSRRATPAERAAAEALYDQGRELMERGRAEEACPKFEESQRLDSGLGTQYHLAGCYEAVGKTASAYALYLAVAAQARDLGQTRREQLARDKAEAVEAKLVRLRISVPQQGQKILIERDGSEVGRAQWGTPMPVDPGAHRIRASGPGLAPWETEVIVPTNAGVVNVSVPPLIELERTSFWAPTTRKLGAAALGVGVASLGLGTAFAVHAHSKKGESYRAGCNDDQCPTPDSLEIRNAALTAGNRATWAMGIGASTVAAGTVLFLWEPTGEASDREGVRVAPVALQRGGGVRVVGWF